MKGSSWGKRLLILSLILGGGSLLYHPFLSLLAKGVIAGTFSSADSVTYDKIFWKEGSLCISGLDVKDTAYFLKVEEIRCDLHLTHLSLQVEHPEILLTGLENTEKKLPPFSLLTFMHLAVSHGVLQLPDTPRLYFNIDAKAFPWEVFSLSYDPLAPPVCEIEAKVTKEYIETRFIFRELPSAQIYPLLPLSFKEPDGLVSLAGSAVWSAERKLLSLECGGEVSHFSLSSPWEVSAESLSYALSYLPQHQEELCWDALNVELRFSGGALKTPTGLHLERGEGQISFKEHQDPTLELSGVLRKGETILPFSVSGKGEADLKQHHFLCQIGEISKISGEISLSDKNHVQISSQFEHIRGEDLFLCTGLDLKGVYNGALTIEGEGTKVQRIYGDQLHVSNLAFQDQITAETFVASFDLVKEEEWKVKSSHCLFTAADFHYGTYFGKGLNGAAELNNNHLSHLELEGNLCGFQGTITPSPKGYTGLCDFTFAGSLHGVDDAFKESCTFSGTLFEAEGKYDLLGTLSYGKVPLNFGICFSEGSVKEGWVEQDHLGPSFYLPLLQNFSPHLHGEGEISLLFNYTPHEWTLNLGSSGLLFSTEEIQAVIGDKTSLLLSYVPQTGVLRAFCPLNDLSFQVDTQPWRVEHLKGDLILENNVLTMSHYQALLFDIPIRGEGSFSWDHFGKDFKGKMNTLFPENYPLTDLEISLAYDEKSGIEGMFCAKEKKHVLSLIQGKGAYTSSWNFHIDPTSHLFGVPLAIEALRLSSRYELEELSLKPKIPLKIIPYLITSLQKFPLISDDFGEELLSLNLEGEIALDLHYKHKDGWDFRTKGKELKFRGKKLQEIAAQGRGKEGTLFFDQIEWDQCKLQCNLSQHPQGGILLSSLKGTHRAGEFLADAHIHEGKVSGEGSFSYQVPSHLTLKTLKKVPFTYTDQGLQIAPLPVNLYDTDTGSHLGHLEIQEARYEKEALSLNALSFSFSPTLLSRFDQLPALCQDLHPEGYFEGTCDLLYSTSQGVSFKGTLKEGTYTFSHHSLPLEKITLSYDPSIFACRLKTYLQEETPLWVETHINIKQAPYGILKLTPSLNEPGIKALFKTEEKIFKWESIQGELYGLGIDLVKSPTSHLPKVDILSGTITCDFKTLKTCFDPKIQKKFESLKLGSGYAFQGDLLFKQGPSLNMTASGNLYGKKTELLGFSFESFSGKIKYASDQIELSQLKLLDPAGAVEIKKFLCQKQQEDWVFSIPLLQLKELRPSALPTPGLPQTEAKPFLITNCSIEGIRGSFSDLSTWEGEGRLHFTNAVKKDPSFWDAPLDLLKKLGLDPSLLTPVCGDIDLKLCGDKIYLDHLKNSFSEGERAQFFLAIDKGASYVDLDGNMQIDIRMRQDVLLKLTESLILTIRGTLEKPKYRLQY